MALEPDARNLKVVMALWACAGLLAATIGFYKIKQMKMGDWSNPVNWVWIKRGITVSIAFLFATLALRGVQTFDRYWIEVLGGNELVAAYVILIGVASTMMVFLDAAVFSFA